jgi:hypothetical protein
LASIAALATTWILKQSHWPVTIAANNNNGYYQSILTVSFTNYTNQLAYPEQFG